MPTKKTQIDENVLKSTSKSSKKVASKKSTTRKANIKKDNTASKKKNAKATSSKTATRKASTKKSTTNKTTQKTAKISSKSSRVSRSRKSKSDRNENISLLNTDLTQKFNISEYYDLPEKYEQTVVKILAQTPNTLFVYWDISEDDRKRFIETYGQYFFYDTKPVLKITNLTKNYTFEVDINDFANCWYIHVSDAKCKYNIELGRKPISSINIPNNYVYISSSNTIEAPNDHILFENKQNMVYFKNVKTNQISSKPIVNFTLLRNLGKFYNIYEFYKDAYKDEEFSTSTKLMGNSSSVFK